jgi:hypothetical protein
MNTVMLPSVDVIFLVAKGVLYKLRNKKLCREVLTIAVYIKINSVNQMTAKFLIGYKVSNKKHCCRLAKPVSHLREYMDEQSLVEVENQVSADSCVMWIRYV